MVLLHLYRKNYSQEMSKIHKKTTTIGEFEIRRVKVPKGNQQQHWMKELGMCRSVFETNFPSVQLRQGGTLWMSDVPMEQETNNRALDEARGDVLECGLGIGMFTHLASKKDEVRSITVVEKYSDVIKLVYPKIKTPKTNYVNMDMLEYLMTTKERYDMIHVDIWADIINYHKMHPIIKMAKRKLKPNGTVVCWLDESLKQVLKEIKKGARNSQEFGYLPPCITCGKEFRNDFGGFCMDCADALGISEIFLKQSPKGVKK